MEKREELIHISSKNASKELLTFVSHVSSRTPDWFTLHCMIALFMFILSKSHGLAKYYYLIYLQYYDYLK